MHERSADSLLPDGLGVTDEGRSSLQESYLATRGATNASYDFWLEFRPSVAEQHRARTKWYGIGGGHGLPMVLALLHYYVTTGFVEGIAYELELSRNLGAKRGELLDLLSLAFIHSGHKGMYAAAASAEFFRNYEDVPARERFPDGWSHDQGFFASGMDFGSPDVSESDISALHEWYLTRIGEVPESVRFLGLQRPGLLKAYRRRYEDALHDALPAQMLPFVLLHWSVANGDESGMRENALLCRALDMRREDVLDAVCSATLHSGIEALALTDKILVPVLSTWSNDPAPSER